MSNVRGLRLLSTKYTVLRHEVRFCISVAQSLDVLYIILCETVNFGLPSILDLLPRSRAALLGSRRYCQHMMDGSRRYPAR
ncbi:hypothetical protein OIDMADRAFT_17114 [Oidiodendron maius Zn]|uniref:Uncharacterized protein n=1 Tax=Oidiodendron maius (strain Zn) TaxID=913774 RepID=A0A0C3HCJ0_OIDMZ|nr:hypothetical protein OIDMADRAFT_17114 [Oidiodendron maius Zn]